MSEIDSELQSWSESWRRARQPEGGAPLRVLVQSKRRRILAVTVGETILILSLVALSGWILRDRTDPWERVWLATLWTFLVIAAAFAWWNRRGLWKPLDESVAEYVRLARLRCERQRRTIRFVIVLFAMEVVVIVAQLAWFGRLSTRAAVLLSVAGICIAAWVVYTRRRIERELEAIGELGL